jgi:hypothetical protein
VNPPSLLQGPDQAQNATDIAKRKKSPFDVGAWPWWLKVLVLGIVLPLLLLAGYLLLVRWLKARRRLRHASTGPVPGRAAWVWRDVVAGARALGVRVPRRATRREQAVLVDAALAAPATTAAVSPTGAVPPTGALAPTGAVASTGAVPPTGAVAPTDAVAPTGAVASTGAVPPTGAVAPTSTGAAGPTPGTAPSSASAHPASAGVVAAAVDAVVFGTGDGDPDAVLALHADAEEVLAELRAGASRRVRWRSDADPRPLFAHTERTGGPRSARRRVPGIRRRSDPTPA